MDEWERKIGLADMHGVVAEVGFSPDDGEFEPMASVALVSGGARIQAFPTVEALRQFGAAVLDAADALSEAKQ